MAEALTAQDIARVALTAGFPRDQKKLQTAIAIALAESEGDPAAVNAGSGATGLWQILPSAHPQYDRNRLTDPAYNASAMVAISANGTNWRPWETYTNGRYLTRMAYAGIGAMDVLRDFNAGTPGDLDAGAAVADSLPGTGTLGTLGDVLARLTDPTLVTRVAKVVIGLALVVVGIVILNRDLVESIAGATPAGHAVETLAK